MEISFVFQEGRSTISKKYLCNFNFETPKAIPFFRDSFRKKLLLHFDQLYCCYFHYNQRVNLIRITTTLKNRGIAIILNKIKLSQSDFFLRLINLYF